MHTDRYNGPVMTRRTLLGATALGIGTLMLTACTTPGTTKGAATERAGRAARMTIGTRPQNSLNPALVNHVAMVQRLVYDGLLGFDAAGKIVGVLADSFEWADDAFTTVDLTLKPGLLFSDGDALDADAVVKSFTYFQKAAGPEASLYRGIAAKKTGDMSVRFRSETSNPDLPFMLTNVYYGGSVISPTGVSNPGSLETESHGIGPYVYGTMKAGVEYQLVANDKYFDASRVHFDKIVLPILDTEAAQTQSLMAGQCDLTYGGTLTASWTSVTTSSSLTLTLGTPAWAGLNLLDRTGQLVPALGNQKVRQAIMYALDRKAITEAVYGSDASPRVQPANESWLGFDSSLESTYGYDLEKAKKLLEEAGYAKGFTLPVAVAAGDVGETLLQAMDGYLRKVGISLDIKTTTDISALITLLNSGSIAGTSFPTNGQYSVAQLIDSYFTENAGLNPLHQVDDRLLALYTAARQSNAKEDWTAVIAYLNEQALTIPISNTPDAWISRDTVDVGGAYNSKAGIFDVTQIAAAQ
ncbi:ABC transporter substrate-binding protein [Microbacterium horticulturae]|uniref:ABC transporter substrate-binding protein n=1 Tax=Microbacterium horticulturae TaxID=3028316 RepID=A0ABY8BY97_9MICO|nr:ABC transporter substrate-binding protein [Microbacterium sp. KACC 23027]WEG08477.1 ABC transporter substrate-binding protein [Microbacterium sp. KACC 23027]